MKTLLAPATMALALILPATAGAATVGTTTVHSGGASTAKGDAKAYRFTAASSGPVDRLNVYLDDANTASEVEVGLYSGADSSAGTRRGRCVISSPQANAWNRCTFTAYSISAGAYYWLALLHPSGASGNLKYREGQVSGAPASYLSEYRSLPSLPATWTNASQSGDAYQASIYADQAGSPPPRATATVTGFPTAPTSAPARRLAHRSTPTAARLLCRRPHRLPGRRRRTSASRRTRPCGACRSCSRPRARARTRPARTGGSTPMGARRARSRPAPRSRTRRPASHTRRTRTGSGRRTSRCG